MQPHARVTRYTVSCFPEGDEDASAWDVTVEERAPGRWAVCWLGQCANSSGRWQREPIPSYRTDRWKAGHRFTLGKALSLADRIAPKVIVNGTTPAEWLEHKGLVG